MRGPYVRCFHVKEVIGLRSNISWAANRPQVNERPELSPDADGWEAQFCNFNANILAEREREALHRIGNHSKTAGLQSSVSLCGSGPLSEAPTGSKYLLTRDCHLEYYRGKYYLYLSLPKFNMDNGPQAHPPTSLAFTCYDGTWQALHWNNYLFWSQDCQYNKWINYLWIIFRGAEETGNTHVRRLELTVFPLQWIPEPEISGNEYMNK